jgi:hypothetical protein
MAEERDIKYSNKDFASLRQQLMSYAKSYFPDSYNDFSPTSPGMLFMEQAAYVGDLMSFYQDIQLQETFLEYAQEKENLYNLAYLMGYKPKVVSPATVDLEVFQRVPAKLVGGQYEPDMDYAMIIGSDFVAVANTSAGTAFYTNAPIDFSVNNVNSPLQTTIFSSTGNVINEFLLKKTVKAYAGEIKTKEFVIGDAEQFLTLTLSRSTGDIAGILEVTDPTNTWYEVPYLGQDTVFVDKSNTGLDSNDVPYVLELKETPRRFITRYDTAGNLNLQFGSGTTSANNSTFTPDPAKIADANYGGISTIDVAYDPTNLLFTDGYGLAPKNTTITVKYLETDGIIGNVQSNTITNLQTANISFVGSVINNEPYWVDKLSINNPKAAQGGKDADTPDEIRQNAMASFAAQRRAVTRADYSVRALTLPPKYGSIAKAYAAQEQLRSFADTTDQIIDSNPLAVSLYVLAYDNDRKLVPASTTLKENIKTYISEYRMLTDAVNIRDAFVVNIGVEYEVVVLPEYNAREVLVRVQEAVKAFFDISRWTINQPIELSKLYTAIDRVKGVQSAENIKIVNKVDGSYSNIAYDVEGARKRNVIYPSYDPMIFEVKFPDRDIVGRITNI